MNRSLIKTPFHPLSDLMVLSVVTIVIYGSVITAQRWTDAFQPQVTIDLSLSSLPIYALFSMFRAIIAYILSFVFTIVVGYLCAKRKSIERVIIPMLDIGQSIPVLGFLPGLVLGLIGLFPNSNFGLELACIIMIFTGQVWNMTFSFYTSLKSVPRYFYELSDNIKLSTWERFWKIEFPFSANNLAWNSLMSMAGGWFFLAICEAFTLDSREFHVPGLGSYMSLAIANGDYQAMLAGLIAMVLVIVGMDFIIWRPIVFWTKRFRIDDSVSTDIYETPFAEIFFKESIVISWLRKIRKIFYHKSVRKRIFPIYRLRKKIQWNEFQDQIYAIVNLGKILLKILGILIVLWCIWILLNMASILFSLTPPEISLILKGSLVTFVRVMVALIIATIWTVPAGIWIGSSQKLTKYLQPVIQIAASFPAPMLFPLVIMLLNHFHVPLKYGSIILILLGVQWYVLFNVLAGATTISVELLDSFKLMGISRIESFKKLYLPSIFPALVTGWISAAGGAWNASIVSEFVQYKGDTIKTLGLGSIISEATTKGNYPLLAGALLAMVLFVTTFNRLVWRRIYVLVENRYRFER